MVSIEKIFTRHFSKQGKPSFFFDVDGTLKESDTKKYPERFNPVLPGLLFCLQQLGDVGINTDQSGGELQRFKQSLDYHLPLCKSSFTGPYLLEGGHIVVPAHGSLLTDQQLLIDQETVDEITAIYNLLVATILIEDEWISLPDLPIDVLLPAKVEQGQATKLLFEKGPTVDDPIYKGEYAEIENWLFKKALQAGLLSQTELLEAGNGTLRIIKTGVNKGSGFNFLNVSGIDLSQVIYSGDQLNEVPAVRTIKEHGGTVVLPSNHHVNLRQYADYISEEPSSDGIVQMFSIIV
jgi:hydroxymethylpyrimidine pyrophosphatase-like HAD family hydrolase